MIKPSGTDEILSGGNYGISLGADVRVDRARLNRRERERERTSKERERERERRGYRA